jgi:hypothetical protein
VAVSREGEAGVRQAVVRQVTPTLIVERPSAQRGGVPITSAAGTCRSRSGQRKRRRTILRAPTGGARTGTSGCATVLKASHQTDALTTYPVHVCRAPASIWTTHGRLAGSARHHPESGRPRCIHGAAFPVEPIDYVPC